MMCALGRLLQAMGKKACVVHGLRKKLQLKAWSVGKVAAHIVDAMKERGSG